MRTLSVSKHASFTEDGHASVGDFCRDEDSSIWERPSHAGWLIWQSHRIVWLLLLSFLWLLRSLVLWLSVLELDILSLRLPARGLLRLLLSLVEIRLFL